MLYLLASLFALLVPVSASNPGTRIAAPMEPVYELRLYHTHTNERLDIVYRHGDTYDPAALDKLEHFLRDHRTGEVHSYDPRVFDLLRDLAGLLGRSERGNQRGLRISNSLEQRISPQPLFRGSQAQSAHAGHGDRHPSAGSSYGRTT